MNEAKEETENKAEGADNTDSSQSICSTWSVEELEKLADECYSKRWTIGKDYFEGLNAFISLLKAMKIKNTKDLDKVLPEIEHDDYPL